MRTPYDSMEILLLTRLFLWFLFVGVFAFLTFLFVPSSSDTSSSSDVSVSVVSVDPCSSPIYLTLFSLLVVVYHKISFRTPFRFILRRYFWKASYSCLFFSVYVSLTSVSREICWPLPDPNDNIFHIELASSPMTVFPSMTYSLTTGWCRQILLPAFAWPPSGWVVNLVQRLQQYIGVRLILGISWNLFGERVSISWDEGLKHYDIRR